MNKILEKDLKNIRNLLAKVKKQGIDYLQTLDKIPTSHQNIRIEKQGSLTKKGLGATKTLALFNETFKPLMVASGGPRYWGFVTGGATPAAIAGDWLSTIYDQNTQAIKGQGDISANVEIETIHLLLELLNLPKDFTGGFVTGATMSNFTSLAVARQWVGKEQGFDIAKQGVQGHIKVLTATPHSSAVKSLAMLGLGSQNFIKIKTLEGNREALDIAHLKEVIKGIKQPFILISSAGTVNTVDFDDFKAINNLKKQHQFWWHIDAAFGAFAACSPKFAPLLRGWESADSITIDCHKWLNVPYDSAFYLIKAAHKYAQVETFQNSNAPYLGDPLENFSYLNLLPENSRRMRALPTWFSLVAYGKEGYRDIVENSVAMAQKFGNFVENSEKFELLAPVRLNTVCFTLKGIENQDKVLPFLQTLNDTGKVFMTPTVYQNRKGIRAAFVNWLTSEKDVEMVIEIMKA
jgi:glutamate/tyrosine decarboxylase-like PLP-dependent enzyme